MDILVWSLVVIIVIAVSLAGWIGWLAGRESHPKCSCKEFVGDNLRCRVHYKE